MLLYDEILGIDQQKAGSSLIRERRNLYLSNERPLIISRMLKKLPNIQCRFNLVWNINSSNSCLNYCILFASTDKRKVEKTQWRVRHFGGQNMYQHRLKVLAERWHQTMEMMTSTLNAWLFYNNLKKSNKLPRYYKTFGSSQY